MASAFTHAFFAAAMGEVYAPESKSARFWLLSVLCAVLPDADAIRLVCDRETLERRLPHPDMARVGKMASLELLREVAARYDIFSPVPTRQSLSVDSTALAPAEVAELIVRHYHLPTAESED